MPSKSLSGLFEDYRQKGDLSALGEVFDRTAPGLLIYALKKGVDPCRADDLLQNTFLTAMQRPWRFDAERSLRAWLLGILAVEIMRSRAAQGRIPDPSRLRAQPSHDPHAHLESSELEWELSRAIEGLPEPYRSVLSLRLDQDLLPREIASNLSCSPSTVRVRLHRGLTMLRRSLPAGLAGAFCMAFLPESASACSLNRMRKSILAQGKASTTLVGSSVLVPLLVGLFLGATGLGLYASEAGRGDSSEPQSPVVSESMEPTKGQGSTPGLAAQEPGLVIPVVSLRLPDQDVTPAVAMVPSAGALPGREHASVVRARDKSILFGGSVHHKDQADTWIREKGRWHQARTQISPPSRSRHGAVYDKGRERVVLFGGKHGRTDMGDTWEFDGQEWIQKQLTEAPSPRYFPGMVYDSQHKQVVLFGGTHRSLESLDDTWTYDGEQWYRVQSRLSPPPRVFASMSFDETRGVTILWGGWSPESARFRTDTWQFDGEQWTRLDTQVHPEGRSWHAMAYEPTRQSTILYGGLNATGHLSDAWELDGDGWKRLGDLDHARVAADMVFDADSNQLLIVGGIAPDGSYGDEIPLMLPWQGSTWIGRSCGGGRLQAQVVMTGHGKALDLRLTELPLGGKNALFLFSARGRSLVAPALALRDAGTFTCQLRCERPLLWSPIQAGQAHIRTGLNQLDLGSSKGLLLQALSFSPSGLPLISPAVQLSLD